MTAGVSVAVLARLGWASRFSHIEIDGRTATESAFRFGRQLPGIGSETKRSFSTTSVIDELMDVLPPRSEFRACDVQAVHAAWEALSAFAMAPDGVAASYAKSMLQWRAVPECVSSLQNFVGAEFVVSTESPAGITERWWVSGDAGWVGLGFRGGQVSMVPSSRADIRAALLVDLVGAIGARVA